LQRAAADTAVITGGVLDVLINNAAYQELDDKFIGFLNL
jgi:NAD(P)-dependent dehydrogenase (short-subunit alcohol dehydrogenase family)